MAPTQSRLVFSTLLLALTALLPSALAQVGTVLDANQLPSCAFNCPAVTNAQTVCVPPAAPVTGQATYQSCFCNSAYLTAFKGTAFVDICNGVCSQNDLSVVRAWYNNLCQAGGAVVTPQAQNAAATGTAAGGTAATTTAGSAAAATSATRYYDPGPQGSWIQTHYNWLIFIIVIILAAIAGIFLGRWLKKRHNRRVADMRAQESGLAAEQAAAAIRSNRHPSEMTITPSGVMRNSLKSRDRFSMYSGTGVDIERQGTPGRWSTVEPPPAMPTGVPAGVLRGSEGKERMSVANVRDLGVGGDSSNSIPRSAAVSRTQSPVPGGNISRTASPMSAAGERRKSTLRKSMR